MYSVYVAQYVAIKIRLGKFLFSTRKMFKFSRTLYGNRQIIQFARILVEFVVRLLKDTKIA